MGADEAMLVSAGLGAIAALRALLSAKPSDQEYSAHYQRKRREGEADRAKNKKTETVRHVLSLLNIKPRE